MKSLVLFFFVVLSLTSCQVKETKSSGGLIANHKPTDNAFTIISPAAGVYASGDVIPFILKFPYPVIVDASGGVPRIKIIVGSSTISVPLTSGHGTTKLVFEYTVAAGLTDNDGVAIKSLDLNGGSLKFDNNGDIQNCDVDSVDEKIFSSVKIDNSPPVVSGFSLQTIAGFYTIGKFIDFKMTFSETVVVTGTPRFVLNFTTNSGSTIYANYISGSGSNVLIFRYVITNEVADTNGFDSIVSPLELNSGTIKDLADNNITNLSFSTFTASVISASANVRFDGRVPFVTSITPPVGDSYSPSEVISTTFHFNRPVTVTGSPTLLLTFTSGTKLATYHSGSGSSSLVFRYTVVPGDSDADGITMATSLTANGGSILGMTAPTNNYFSQALNNFYSVPSLTNVIINAAQPQITAVSRSADYAVAGSSTTDNIWIIGQQLQLTLSFNHAVTVNQIGGVPRVPLTIGGTTRYASYVSGSGTSSLFFQYNIQQGDLDADTSIALSDLDLNGGTITDQHGTNTILTMPVPALTSTSVDGVRPSIDSVGAPTNGTYSTLSGVNHLNFLFTVNWSEPVNYSGTTSGQTSIALTIGATPVNALYASGNNTSSVVYRPSSLATYNDLNGIAMASTLSGTAVIKDFAGNTASAVTFTAPITSAINVDTTPPTLTSLVAPSSRYYLFNQPIDFTANFSESVSVNVVTGYPRISIDVGGVTKYLVPTASGTGSSHTYRYTVVDTDLDTDGVATGTSVEAGSSGAYTRDAGQNLLTGSFTAPITTAILVDGSVPSITSVAKPSDGTYEGGNALTFTITFSEAITVVGTPSINLPAQTGTLQFNYATGSGSDTLTFSRSLTSSDFDLDGLGSVATMTMNSGSTLKDAGGNAAPLTFTTQNLSQVFIAYPNTVIWTAYDFVNRAPSSSTVSLIDAGTASQTPCGSSTCREFDGDDSLSISDPITGAENIFVAFKTHSGLGSYDVITPEIALLNDGSKFDLVTADASVNSNGTVSSGTTHNTDYDLSSVVRLGAELTTPANYSAGIIIPNSFYGSIGELIIINGPLTNIQKSNIQTYLNSKY